MFWTSLLILSFWTFVNGTSACRHQNMLSGHDNEDRGDSPLVLMDRWGFRGGTVVGTLRVRRVYSGSAGTLRVTHLGFRPHVHARMCVCVCGSLDRERVSWVRRPSVVLVSRLSPSYLIPGTPRSLKSRSKTEVGRAVKRKVADGNSEGNSSE